MTTTTRLPGEHDGNPVMTAEQAQAFSNKVHREKTKRPFWKKAWNKIKSVARSVGDVAGSTAKSVRKVVRTSGRRTKEVGSSLLRLGSKAIRWLARVVSGVIAAASMLVMLVAMLLLMALVLVVVAVLAAFFVVFQVIHGVLLIVATPAYLVIYPASTVRQQWTEYLRSWNPRTEISDRATDPTDPVDPSPADDGAARARRTRKPRVRLPEPVLAT